MGVINEAEILFVNAASRLRMNSLSVKCWYIPSMPKRREELNNIYRAFLSLRSVFKVSATTKKKTTFCVILPKKDRKLMAGLLLIKIERKQIIAYVIMAKLIYEFSAIFFLSMRFLIIKKTIAIELKISIMALDIGRKNTTAYIENRIILS